METIALDKSEYQLNSRVRLSIETSVESMKIAHLGPVLCRSSASTVKVTTKIGIQDVEGSVTREKLQSYLKTGFDSFFSFKFGGDEQKEIEKKIIATQESTIENTWTLNPEPCRKIEHEIYQHVEVNVITVFKKGFLNSSTDVYKYRINLPFFDIQQNSESITENSCASCSKQHVYFNNAQRPISLNDKNKNANPFKFFVVGEGNPAPRITFPVRVEINIPPDHQWPSLYFSVAALDISFILPFHRNWERDSSEYHTQEFAELIISDLSRLKTDDFLEKSLSFSIPVIEAPNIESILARSADIEGKTPNFIGIAEWGKEFASGSFLESTYHIRIIGDSDSSEFIIKNDEITFKRSKSKMEFIDAIVGDTEVYRCGLMLDGHSYIPTHNIPNTKYRQKSI